MRVNDGNLVKEECERSLGKSLLGWCKLQDFCVQKQHLSTLFGQTFWLRFLGYLSVHFKWLDVAEVV